MNESINTIMTEEIRIKRKKGVHVRILISTGLSTIVMGNFMLSNPLTSTNTLILPIFILIFGLLTLFLFINAIVQLSKKTPALIVGKTGLTDHISIANAGLIPWGEIEKFEISHKIGDPQLMVFVKTPEKYMTGKSGFKTTMLERLLQDKGSPIALNLSMIDYNGIELISLLRESKAKYEAH